jgi:hypothetical protein
VLLRQLARLQLTHLDLAFVLEHSTAPAAYWARKLAFLSVKCCALPEGAWQHLFPARGGGCHSCGRLVLSAMAPELSTSDAARLAACCPSLDVLEADLQLGAALQPLAQR